MTNAMGNVGINVIAGSGHVVIVVIILGVMITTHAAESNSFRYVVYCHLASAVIATIHANL